jgi:uncharacterized membrane protein (DUF2068 family)
MRPARADALLAPSRRDRGIELIALFKFAKTGLLIAAGLGLLDLLRPAVAARVKHWLSAIALRSGLHIVDRAVAAVGNLDYVHARVVGIGAIVYGLLFAVEGTGLWLERRWAEYLTVVTTGVLIPLEIYELLRRVTAVRVVALLVNLAAVAYLGARLVQGGRRRPVTG